MCTDTIHTNINKHTHVHSHTYTFKHTQICSMTIHARILTDYFWKESSLSHDVLLVELISSRFKIALVVIVEKS